MSDPERKITEPPRPLEEYQADALELNERRAELTGLHPDRFVIFYRGEVIGEADDRAGLRRLLFENGLGQLNPVIEFLPSKKVTMRLLRS